MKKEKMKKIENIIICFRNFYLDNWGDEDKELVWEIFAEIEKLLKNKLIKGR